MVTPLTHEEIHAAAGRLAGRTVGALLNMLELSVECRRNVDELVLVTDELIGE